MQRYAASPTVASPQDHDGFSGPSKDVMDSFRLSSVSLKMNSWRDGTAGGCRLEVPWRHTSPTPPCRSHRGFLFFSAPQFRSQHRVATLLPVGRAPQSIQRITLARMSSGAASAFRRWMPPTVERGPPVQFSV
jgi:hypothetical protein